MWYVCTMRKKSRERDIEGNRTETFEHRYRWKEGGWEADQ